MIAAVFAQNGVLLDDDILGTRKISFQPFYSMKRREIRLWNWNVFKKRIWGYLLVLTWICLFFVHQINIFYVFYNPKFAHKSFKRILWLQVKKLSLEMYSFSPIFFIIFHHLNFLLLQCLKWGYLITFIYTREFLRTVDRYRKKNVACIFLY